jgi:hypothetical protein
VSSLSKKYAAIKPIDKRRLSDQQLADLFVEAKTTSNKMTLYYLYYHHMRRRPASATPAEYVPLAAAVLDKMNGTKPTNITRLKLEQKDGGNHLDLSRSNFTLYSLNILGVYRRNILQSLDLKSLDISHTGLKELSELRGLKLDELRMVGVNISGKKTIAKQLEPLGLKRIILDVDSYPKDSIAELRKQMFVVDSKK